MGTIISTIGEIENIRWTQLKKGRVTKAKRILMFNDNNHAIVELETGEYTVVGGRHNVNGHWAVSGYGLDHFTQAVLHGLVRIGILNKKQVAEHIATADERKRKLDRKYSVKRIRELCLEIGVEPPVMEETP